jgi:hypothetical protein
MAKTPNHEYSKPARGTENWDQPINDNFGALDVDIEIRDVAANRSTYDPVEGAKFLATDTGVVSVGVSGSTGPVWTPVFVLPGYRSSGAGTDAVFDVPVTVAGLTVGAGVLDLDGSSLVDSAGVNDSVTVAGNSVALGGSTAIAHADLDSVTSDQHHAEDHDHTGGISVVPNAGLANSSVTVAGQTVLLGGSTDVDYVDLGDTGGSFPIANADIANSSVTVSAGTGLTGGGATSLGNSTTLGITPGGVGTTELDTPFVDLPTLFGDPVSVGGTLQASGALTVATNGGDRALELGVPRSDGTGSTAGGNVLAGSPSNSIAPVAVGGVVAGGGSSTSANEVSANYGTVSGGQGNTASGPGATVAGGNSNTARGAWATVGGGFENTAGVSLATVPGGVRGAAEGSSSFVWNDGTGYHDIPNSSPLGLSSNKNVNGEPVTGNNTFSVGATGGVRFITGGSSVTYIDSGSTGWSTTSSRAVKTNIDPVDPEDALAGVEEMEVATWEYTDEDGDGAGTTHIGPMAEEFHDAFDVGSSDEHINSINADGVALAAIQGLSAKLDEKAERIADLEAENEQLRERNAELEERLAAVEEHLGLADGKPAQGVADD